MTGEATRALAVVTNRWRQFSDLRALADVRLDLAKEKQQFTGVVLLKAPTSFRFEALSPLGAPMLLAIVHEGQFTTFDVAGNLARIEPATPETAARLVHLALDPVDLVGLFAGHAVPPKDLRVATVVPPDEHGPSLEMVGPLNSQRVWMDFKTGVPQRIRVSGGRIDVLFVFEHTGDGTLAGFNFVAAQEHVTGSIRYRDVVVGAGVETERFRLTIPPGATIERLR